MKVELPTVTREFLQEICKDATNQDIEARIMSRPRIKLDPKNKPVMSAVLEAEIESALARYLKAPLWKEWGMMALREQGNAVLLEGPPGTGKTTIIRWMAKRLGKPVTALNMKDVGGKAPGHTERMVAETFKTARENQHVLFIDECEAILWDRNKAGSDTMWMVGVIDELLMQIASFPYLIGLATNRPGIIDEALLDRCFAVLHIPMPEHPERLRLWEQKLPDRFPLKLTTLQRDKLAELSLSGRQIENAIVHEASNAITENRKPTFETLLAQAQKLSHRNER